MAIIFFFSTYTVNCILYVSLNSKYIFIYCINVFYFILIKIKKILKYRKVSKIDNKFTKYYVSLQTLLIKPNL